MSRNVKIKSNLLFELIRIPSFCNIGYTQGLKNNVFSDEMLVKKTFK